MDKENLLKKINRELKIYMNESSFISIKCRNKVISYLNEAFSVNLPIDNYKSVDITITETGSIIMRDEEYKPPEKLNKEEIEEKYENFKIKADSLLEKKEISFESKFDKNNYLNILVLILLVIVSVAIIIYAITSFFNGDFYHCLWLLVFILPLFSPSLKERLRQAIDFIKRKLKK